MTPRSPRSFPPGRLALTILLATGLLASTVPFADPTE